MLCFEPSTSYATLTSPVSALVAVINVLADIFAKWPLYFSHGPAADIVSVVHFPDTLTSTRKSSRSWCGNGANGSNRASLSEVGETATLTEGFGRCACG